jgi:hypothetical protein
MRYVGYEACMGDRRGACRLLVDRPEEKGLHRRPGHREEENIKMDFKKLEWQAWIGLISLRIGTGGRCLRMW